MLSRLLATFVMLVLAFVAFSADALNTGYFGELSLLHNWR